MELAIQMLDESDFRLGESAPGGKMKVVAADFSYKTQKDAPAKGGGKDKKKIIRKTQKLNKSVSLAFEKFRENVLIHVSSAVAN